MRQSYCSILLVSILIVASGCSSKQQQYTVVSFTQKENVIRERKMVVEVTVKETPGKTRTLWWVSPLAQEFNMNNMIAVVDRVIKGDESAKRLTINDYRSPTKEERSLSPDGQWIHPHSRLLLAYDSRWFNSYKNLQIVPIGNTQEYEEAMKQLRKELANRPTSRAVR